jgi:hypothetical protein
MPVQLILEKSSVQEARKVSFHLSEADKHPENPVLMPGYPHEWDSLQVNWNSVVLYDAEENIFRCWYAGLDAIQYDINQYPERQGFAKWLGRIWRTGYAESEDGINWVKPALGQYKHNSRDTNVLRSDYEVSGTGIGFDHFTSVADVWLNPAPKNEKEKFMGLFGEIGADEKGFRNFKEFRKVIYCSPDGKRWTRDKVTYEAPSDRNDRPAPNVADLYSVVIDDQATDAEMRVKVYGQTDRPISSGFGNRGVGVVCGPDLYSLSYDRLRVLLEGEEPYDSEIHWSAVRKLQNGYYIMIYDSSRYDYESGFEPPFSDIKLAASRDGIDFKRIHPGKPLIPTGSKAMFDANMLVCGSIVEYGDMVYIYYHGAPSIFRPWPRTPRGVSVNLRASVLYPTYMGLATIQRDRFAFAEGPGKLVSMELTPGSDGVWLNADGRKIPVEALDSSTRKLSTGFLGNERRQTVYRKVIWEGPAPSVPCSLGIELKQGERLFSIGW